MNEYLVEDAYAVHAANTTLSILLGFYGLILVINITMYVLQSIGLYTLADRRGLRHAWLAWLPVGNIWLIGAIADHYRTITRGEKQNRRLAILILSIAVYALVILAVVLIFVPIFRLAVQAGSGAYLDEGQIIGQVLSGYFSGIGLAMLGNLTSIALLVVQYVCLYDVYASCSPDSKTLYILLSILLGLAPVFLFVCRKKDLGMFPQPAPQPVPYGQPVYQQPVYQQPVYQQPVYQQPVYQQPVYQQPVDQQPPTQPAEETNETV